MKTVGQIFIGWAIQAQLFHLATNSPTVQSAVGYAEMVVATLMGTQ
jgi:hypothetical protein